MEDSEIINFFKHQTVFITGGTGFLGKVLVEKLLRTCDVHKIHLLVRPKKGKTVQERIETFFNYPCFDRLKKEKLFENLITFVEGDCAEMNLGINSESEKVLIDETTVFIHAAANVKFDQSLQEAASNIVRGTREALKLAKKMVWLKAFVYVSTAYSNCPQSHIVEEFYDPPITDTQFLNENQYQVSHRTTKEYIKPWPNTYTFAKSIAESVINRESNELPVCVIRPAIVTSTYQEPVKGWVDNFYGLMGLMIGGLLGVIRSCNAKKDYTSHLVPCDYVVNLILASAWDICKNRRSIPIYNYVGWQKNFITYGQLLSILENCLWTYPMDKVIWYKTLTLRESRLWHKICLFFQHTLVAYIVDFFLICLRRQPLAVQNYRRLDKFLALTSYFSMNRWTFESKNVDLLWAKMGDTDKKLFDFNMKHLDWKCYCETIVLGGRIYLLKDLLETIPRAERKVKMLRIAHYTLMTLLYFLLFCILLGVVKTLF